MANRWQFVCGNGPTRQMKYYVAVTRELKKRKRSRLRLDHIPISWSSAKMVIPPRKCVDDSEEKNSIVKVMKGLN